MHSMQQRADAVANSLSRWKSCVELNSVRSCYLPSASLQKESAKKRPEILTISKKISVSKSDKPKVNMPKTNVPTTTPSGVTKAMKVISIVLFGWSSFSLLLINKVIFVVYDFEWFYFLAAAQSTFTLTLIVLLNLVGAIKIRSMSFQNMIGIFPVQIYFLGGLIAGFGGTKYLSVPMFTTIRRLGVPMTLAIEWFMLNTPLTKWKLSCVSIILLGSCIALTHDFSFSLKGYFFTFTYNLCTVLELTYIKKRLSEMENMNSLMFMVYSYSNSLPLLIIACWVAGEYSPVLHYAHWKNPPFVMLFAVNLFFGALLNYTAILCNEYNSPVTVAVVSNIKNVGITYAGVFLGLDYIFNVFNFIGITICLFGSLAYTYMSISTSTSQASDKDEKPIELSNFEEGEKNLRKKEWGGSMPTIKISEADVSKLDMVA